MDNMEPVGLIIAVVIGLIALALAFTILMYGFHGAILQFAWASEFGFVGVVVFLAAWVFMFPIMAIWAVIWGWSERSRE